MALIHRREQADTAGLYFDVKPATVLWRRLTVPVVRYWAINRVTCCREYPLTLMSTRITTP